MSGAISESKRGWRLPSIAPVELDKTDLRILSILQQNCRIKTSMIARHLRCSKAGVHYRIHRLEENGVIRGYKTHFNLFSKHFIYHLFFVAYAGEQPLTDFMNVLHARDDVVVLMSIFGEKNLMIGCAHSDEKEFQKFIEWLNPYCGKGIEEFSRGVSFSNMQLDYSGFYENITLLGLHKDSSFLSSFGSKKIPPMPIESADFALIHLLQRDARLTLTELAEKTNRTKPAIRKRIDELIRSGIISKFSASVTPYAFTGMVFVVLRIRARSKKQLLLLKRRMLELKNGNGLVELDGPWDLIAFLHFSHAQALTQFRENLPMMFPEARAFQLDIVHEQSKLEWTTPSMAFVLRP